MKTIILTLFSTLVLSAASAGSNADKQKQDVMAAMDAYKNAMTHKDGAVLAKVLAEDLTYVHSNGMVETKGDVIQSVVSGKAAVDRIEFLPDTEVRIHGKVAYVAGKEDLWHPTVTIHMHVLHVWEKTPQGWQLVARQATRLGK